MAHHTDSKVSSAFCSQGAYHSQNLPDDSLPLLQTARLLQLLGGRKHVDAPQSPVRAAVTQGPQGHFRDLRRLLIFLINAPSSSSSSSSSSALVSFSFLLSGEGGALRWRRVLQAMADTRRHSAMRRPRHTPIMKSAITSVVSMLAADSWEPVGLNQRCPLFAI
ncbi:hypothetical protein F7725_025345 [Dissostichus mawsoni]|uniref:Uncharacterized protein n=1 Tax=Dissostichus mawsoni TaxID=36200 RepID=A0A7J5XB41_DISMA|nr:hypothetical protein F7725_025345 [Dissostichus mawsoni]